MSQSMVGIVKVTKKEIVDKEIDRIIKKSGSISKEKLLDAARPKSSPLHPFFEWSDGKAAEKWRLDQAYHLIQASAFAQLLKDGADGKTPKLVSEVHQIQVRRLLPSFKEKGTFVMRNVTLDPKESRRGFIEQKKATLRSWCDSVVDVVIDGVATPMPEFEELRKLILSELEKI